MALSNKYRFFISSASITLTKVFPIQDTFEYEFEESDISNDLVKNVSDLTFHKADYTLLKTVEDLGNCEDITLRIDTFCGGAWVTDFIGLIKLRKCNWDLHNCKVTVKAESNGVQKCVDNTSNEEFNVLAGVAFKPTCFSFQGIIETTTCPAQAFSLAPINTTNYVRNNSCINISEGWVIVKNLITNITPNGGFFNGTVETTWARQKVFGGTIPAGSGWISVGVDWVRPIQTSTDLANSYGSYANPLGGDINDERDYSPLFGTGTATAYENGLFVKDVLTYLVNQNTVCNYTIVSDFLSINPDFTSPTNTAYTNALSTLNNLVMWKTAEIKRPTALQKSTKLFISLNELIENLKVLFNVEVSIYKNGATNVFRIEHKSYFDNTNGTDLTLQWENVIEGNKYSYEGDKLPKEIRYYFSTQTDETGSTFDGYPIKFSDSCSDSKTIIEKRAGRTYTNMSFLLDNDSIDDNSIVIAACQDFGGQTLLFQI